MSVPPRSLTLEVWLGPMEGLRYAAEARQAMQLVRIGRLPFDRQTKERNHLVLSVSAGVSGSHAEVRFAQGRIFLRDLGSSNGTFAAQQAVTAETEVKSGEIFLVSLTPVQVYLTSPLAAPPPFEPLPVTHWEGAAVEPLVTSAAECAAARREAYVDTRHLLDAILRLDDPEIDELLAQGGVTRRAAREELYKKSFYRESLAWIAEILVKPANLTGTLRDGRRLAAGRPAPRRCANGGLRGRRPRGRDEARGAEHPRRARRRSFRTRRRLAHRPRHHVRPRRISAGRPARARRPRPARSQGPIPGRSRSRPAGRAGPRRSCRRRSATPRPPPVPRRSHGTRPLPRRPLAAPSPSDSAVAPAPSRRPAPEPESPADGTPEPVRGSSIAHSARGPVSAVPETAPAPIPAPAPVSWGAPRTPAEILLDGRARELADELFVLAGELRFGVPDDRRRQLKRRVEKELAPLPKESRTRFLELLRHYFPVLPAGAGADPEVPRLRRKIEELQKKAVEEGPSKSVARGKQQQPVGVPTTLPLRQLVLGEDLAQADRNVLVLRKVIEYALAMEGMTLGLIQSLTMPGNETMAFKLPGFKETMRSFLHALEQGKPVSVQRIEEYLDELKRWQVAILAAYHQAPGEWFDRLWKRINPVTIESAPRSAGWKLRGEAAEWWDLYKIAARDLSPDLVNDQVLQGVARLSKEELEKLRKNQRGEHS